jgi:hypothetical protein
LPVAVEAEADLPTAFLDASELELTFPGHALERLARTLDPVLEIGSVGGKQLHDLIGAVGGHVADRTRCEVDGLTDLEFVLFQRVSPELERHGYARFRARPPLGGRQYSSEFRACLKKSAFYRALQLHPTKARICNCDNMIVKYIQLVYWSPRESHGRHAAAGDEATGREDIVQSSNAGGQCRRYPLTGGGLPRAGGGLADHNRAAFIAYRGSHRGPRGESRCVSFSGLSSAAP